MLLDITGLYGHFPFCEARCHYCDFYALGKERTKPQDLVWFEEALLQESQHVRAQIQTKPLKSIFFGGGTPSMTHVDVMQKAMRPFENLIDPSSIEWTLEANPSSINPENAKAFRELGINRISLGVQTTHTPSLKWLGRVHDVRMVFDSLTILHAAGFENISVDLMCGIPHQTCNDLAHSIDELMQFPITHMSCYLLTLAPHHPLAKELPKGAQSLEQLQLVHTKLTDYGFEHYEISNFAKKSPIRSYTAQHNLHYWNSQVSYLGLGPSAHSFNAQEKIRWKNPSSLSKYHKIYTHMTSWSPYLEHLEILTPYQIALEQWLLQLRLQEGFSKTWLITERQQEKAQYYQSLAWLKEHPTKPDHLQCTVVGWAMCDTIIENLSPNHEEFEMLELT